VLRQVRASLSALRMPRVSLLYLHAPDPATPINETLDAVAELYAAGAFERLGVSNYQAWEAAHIHGLCVRRGDVPPPTVYQGMYNGLTRDVERELFPYANWHCVVARRAALPRALLSDTLQVPACVKHGVLRLQPLGGRAAHRQALERDA
jgi:aryl-alcohol dehydrogenase-like predicted oxidoreductase